MKLKKNECLLDLLLTFLMLWVLLAMKECFGVCEITLAVLHGNRETLMSVLEPLVHDPLVEALPSKNSARPKNDFMQVMDGINKLLKGQPGGIMPLSVQGHVHKLLEDATNEVSFCLRCVL